MSDEKQRVAICQVRIHCPGIPTYQSGKILPAVPVEDLKILIRSELKKLFQANMLEVDENAFRIDVVENNRKVVDPMFELVRFCANCKLTAAMAGVANESFIHCGHCGKPTGFQLQDPE
jgi:hypothetical protein